MHILFTEVDDTPGFWCQNFSGDSREIMFGPTRPFGKLPSSASGPQSAFGQANNANNSPFVAETFGGTAPFGSPAGGSVFGGTSTGIFRRGFTQTPSLFGPSSSSAFGGSSPFGQNPAFGHFGPAIAQTSTSGTTSHPSQSAFGSSIFGSSTPYGAQSQSEFSASSTPGFGSSTPAFGTTSTRAFVNDSAPSFGAASTPAFDSTMEAAFGTRGITFGPLKAPIFGFGGAFRASSNPSFVASCCSSLSFGSSPSFGLSKTEFRSNQCGSKSHGAHIGSQVATPTFGNTEFENSSFGGQHRGSRVAPFTPTAEADIKVMPLAKLQSICGMTVPVYRYKSHEELRWEDYQWGDKGGPNHAGQSGVSVGPGASPAIPWASFSQSSPFSSTNAFSSALASATPSNSISFTTSSNELSMTAPNPFVPNLSSNAGFWPSPNTSPFGSLSSLTSVVRSPSSAFQVSEQPSIFSSSVSATVGSTPSVISAPTTHSSRLFLSTTPSIAKTASAFRQTPTTFSQTTAPLGQTTTPSFGFGQIRTFSTASSGSGGSLFPSTPSPVLPTNAATISQTKPSFSLSFQTSEAAETSGVCSLGNLGQTRAAGTGGFGSQNAFGQSHCGQSSINGRSSVVQPALVTNAFATFPAVQQLSIGCTETGSPVQYGIFSMPVPFFYDGDNTPSKPEADALFIPRGNPRSLVIVPEYWAAREQKPSPLKKTSPCANDGVPKDGPLEEQTDFVKTSQKIKGVHDDSSLQNDEEYVIINGTGESAIGYDCNWV